MLAGSSPIRAQGEPQHAIVDARANLLVTKKLNPGFDLVDQAVPLDLQPGEVTSVVAAVAGGPHSILAATVASRLATVLNVSASMVSAYPADEEPDAAVRVVEDLYPVVPDIEYRVVAADGMGGLVESLDPNALLVFGAPGGSFFQRRLFGPGARLRSRAPAGAVVVHSAPSRVFQVMGEPVFVGPMLQALDTLRIRSESMLAVADAGRLVGLVRRSRLVDLSPDAPVSEAMEEAVSIGHVEPVEAARPLVGMFGPDPIPVIDDEEFLVGGLTPPGR